jgi:hypothetical protein
MHVERAESLAPEAVPDRAVGLSRTLVALVAAWILPGAGHVLLGRAARGLVFGFLILGSFGLGLAHEGRLALRDARQPILTRLQLVANLGVGPADLIARHFVYGEVAFSLVEPVRSPADEARRNKFRERTRGALSIYGTAYLWTAGLMNLLLLFDVWDIGRGKKP